MLPLPLGSRPVVAGAILGLALCSAVLPPLGGIEALISVFVFREAEEVKSHTFSLLHCSGSVYQILSDGRQIAGCCVFFFFPPIDENTFLIWLHSNQVK